jgi:processive 1,2-diacylglycerol beta-glucosyltransferase
MSEMRKVLIFTASAGAGHISCANALKEALLEKDSATEINIVDMFKLSSITSGYEHIYAVLSRFYPFEVIFNFFHKMIDRYRWFAKVAEIITVVPLYKPTMRVLKEYDPDMVVGNNALLIPVLDKCRKKKEFKYIVTVTDIVTVCRWWASPLADIVFVGTEEAEETLKRFTPECKIVRDYFAYREILPLSDEKYSEIYEHFFSDTKFLPDKPTILITGGGISTRKILSKMKSFLLSSNYQFVILTGRDEKLRRELQEEYHDRDNILVLGFTDRNLDLMAVVDVVISKLGSVSVVEIEKLNKKTIFTRPIGHQEYGNVEYIKRNKNFVFVGRDTDRIGEEIERLLKRDIAPTTAHIQNANAIAEYVLRK